MAACRQHLTAGETKEMEDSVSLSSIRQSLLRLDITCTPNMIKILSSSSLSFFVKQSHYGSFR